MLPALNTALSAAAALGAVLGLVLLAARAAAWSGLARPTARRVRGEARLVLQASLPLDRQRTVHIVRCDGRDLALLAGGSADLCLGWLPERAAPAEAGR